MAWETNNALDKEFISVVRSGDDTATDFEVRQTELNSRIDALEGALASTLPKTPRDAAIVAQMLDYKARNLNTGPLEIRGTQTEEIRGQRNLQLMARGLAEYIASAAEISPIALLPRAYRVQGKSALCG